VALAAFTSVGSSVTVTVGDPALGGASGSCTWTEVGVHCTAPLTVSKPLSASKWSIPSMFVRTSHRSWNPLPAGFVVCV